jgi:Flp pilus assembly protein TadG
MAFSSRRGQKGQMMLVMGLSMAVLAGFTAMAIDVGMAYLDRRDLQNDVDSAALAGVQHLPANTTLAQEKAEEWLLKNNITQDQITSITVESTHVANDTLRVEVDDDFGWIFARAVGMTTSNVGAHARAVVGTLEATSDLMPWSIVQGDSPCLDSSGNAIFGETCAVKLGAQSAYGGGWRGALGIDGETGSSAYEENIVDGEADTLYCIAGQSEPPCEAHYRRREREHRGHDRAGYRAAVRPRRRV